MNLRQQNEWERAAYVYSARAGYKTFPKTGMHQADKGIALSIEFLCTVRVNGTGRSTYKRKKGFAEAVSKIFLRKQQMIAE